MPTIPATQRKAAIENVIASPLLPTTSATTATRAEMTRATDRSDIAPCDHEFDLISPAHFHLAARHTRPVTTADSDGPEHLVVQQAVFAGPQFWAALNRLADRRGHEGHDRYLAGTSEHTDRYALHCATCRQLVATMLVEREAETRRC